MNVYTHIDMNDLAKDIENLPSMFGSSLTVVNPDVVAKKSVNASVIPEALNGLADRWDSLPEHIRSAISTLAGV